MTKKSFAITGGNDYEDSAQGAKRWGTVSKFNNTNASVVANSKNGRTAERPPAKSYSSLSDAEADRPDIPFKSWR